MREGDICPAVSAYNTTYTSQLTWTGFYKYFSNLPLLRVMYNPLFPEKRKDGNPWLAKIVILRPSVDKVIPRSAEIYSPAPSKPATPIASVSRPPVALCPLRREKAEDSMLSRCPARPSM